PRAGPYPASSGSVARFRDRMAGNAASHVRREERCTSDRSEPSSSRRPASDRRRRSVPLRRPTHLGTDRLAMGSAASPARPAESDSPLRTLPVGGGSLAVGRLSLQANLSRSPPLNESFGVLGEAVEHRLQRDDSALRLSAPRQKARERGGRVGGVSFFWAPPRAGDHGVCPQRLRAPAPLLRPSGVARGLREGARTVGSADRPPSSHRTDLDAWSSPLAASDFARARVPPSRHLAHHRMRFQFEAPWAVSSS